MQKALKHDTPPQRPPLTLEAFGRSSIVKEFKRRLEQAAAKAPILLLKGAVGGMAEICARTLKAPRAPWLDLSGVSSALTQEMLEKLSGGVLFVPDLMVLGKMQQMNLAFCGRPPGKAQYATGRRHRHTAQPRSAKRAGTANCWRALARSGWRCRHSPAMPTNCRKSPGLLLTNFVERGEVQPRRFSTGALNALRTQPWHSRPEASWGDLYALVRNLALTALDEEISAEDVQRVMPQEQGAGHELASLLPLLDQPLREARDAFEKLYFEHHFAPRRWQYDEIGGAFRPGAHALVPQAEAT